MCVNCRQVIFVINYNIRNQSYKYVTIDHLPQSDSIGKCVIVVACPLVIIKFLALTRKRSRLVYRQTRRFLLLHAASFSSPRLLKARAVPGQFFLLNRWVWWFSNRTRLQPALRAAHSKAATTKIFKFPSPEASVQEGLPDVSHLIQKSRFFSHFIVPKPHMAFLIVNPFRQESQVG